MVIGKRSSPCFLIIKPISLVLILPSGRIFLKIHAITFHFRRPSRFIKKTPLRHLISAT